MESVAELLKWVLENLNYWVVTIFMAIESSFIPFPSEAVVPPAAWKAMADDSMNIILVVVFATIGADLGALLNYYLAKWLGRPIVYKFANSRFGHMCLINQRKVEQAEAFFDKHGAVSTLIGRMLPAIRQLISIPAGLARMNMFSFILYTCIGACLWNCILVGIGLAFHTQVSKEELISTISRYSHIIGIGIIVLLALIAIFMVYHGFKKNSKNQ